MDNKLSYKDYNGDMFPVKLEPLEVEGHLNPAEADLLEKLASDASVGVIVEIGSLRGKSTIRLAKGARVSKKEVYAIDPHDSFMDGNTLVGVADRAVFLRNLLDAGVADIVKPIYLSSHETAQAWHNNIALLFIDGDHSYVGVKQDIADWMPHIITGGLIAFHDSWFEPVSRAIGELLEDDDYRVVGKADATTVIQYLPTDLINPIKRPDVSVLIPAYNASETIAKAIKSALDQEGVQVEVVIVDDHSMEELSGYINDIFEQNTWPANVTIKSIRHETNQGLAAALNTAAANATGRYFIELDSDDWLEPNCLAKMVKALDEHPEVGLVYGRTQYHGLSNTLFTPQMFQKNIFRFGFASLYAFMYRREAWDNGCRYRSTCVIEGRTITIQDWDMALQLTEHMRWDGLALRDLTVLHYNYVHGSLTDFTQAHNPEVVKAFINRWPIVNIQRI